MIMVVEDDDDSCDCEPTDAMIMNNDYYYEYKNYEYNDNCDCEPTNAMISRNSSSPASQSC